ncbi:TPA: hypothetical protein MCM29_005047 [Klebsiella pneumoniae]|nr:hypothetical protein [Klebsiella pneumoniae]
MYVTSDLHFLHKRVSEFCPKYRSWERLHEMTEGLILAWNEKAKTPGTKMYHLGDFCFGTPEETDLIASRLNGDITFIVGNHDYSKHREVLEKYGEVKYYDEVKYGKKFFVLCHYPIASWNKQGRGAIMLHGHSHGSFPDEMYGKMLDVGWDAQGKILHFDEIIAKMERREIKVVDHHKNFGSDDA